MFPNQAAAFRLPGCFLHCCGSPLVATVGLVA
jgi:hypothetical protein